MPKPLFHNLFESLKHMPDNKVIIFRPGTKQKETGSRIAQEPDYAMVEAGEVQSLSYRNILNLLIQRQALAVKFLE